MQIPKTLDKLDEAGFNIWLRRYGVHIYRASPNSACVIRFEVRRRGGLASPGAIWTYGGAIEFQGCALLNYALFLMRGKPALDPKNTYRFEEPYILYNPNSSSGGTLRKKRSFRQKILARDGNLCFYCGVEMPNDDITLEHLIPRSMGGKTTPENIVLAHAYCNNRAGILCYDEKLALRGKIKRPRDAWLENHHGKLRAGP